MNTNNEQKKQELPSLLTFGFAVRQQNQSSHYQHHRCHCQMKDIDNRGHVTRHERSLRFLSTPEGHRKAHPSGRRHECNGRQVSQKQNGIGQLPSPTAKNRGGDDSMRSNRASVGSTTLLRNRSNDLARCSSAPLETMILLMRDFKSRSI